MIVMEIFGSLVPWLDRQCVDQRMSLEKKFLSDLEYRWMENDSSSSIRFSSEDNVRWQVKTEGSTLNFVFEENSNRFNGRKMNVDVDLLDKKDFLFENVFPFQGENDWGTFPVKRCAKDQNEFNVSRSDWRIVWRTTRKIFSFTFVRRLSINALQSIDRLALSAKHQERRAFTPNLLLSMNKSTFSFSVGFLRVNRFDDDERLFSDRSRIISSFDRWRTADKRRDLCSWCSSLWRRHDDSTHLNGHFDIGDELSKKKIQSIFTRFNLEKKVQQMNEENTIAIHHRQSGRSFV